MSRDSRGKGSPPNGAGPSSFEANRLSRLVSELPLTVALSTKPVEVPRVKAPSLDGLEVTIPQPEDLSEDELATRLHELVRAHSTKKDRKHGDFLVEGDDVRVDLLAYCDGKLIPHSARQDEWMELRPIAALPGLMEGLVGAKVGSGVQVLVKLPSNYPAKKLAGKTATFLVDVLGAREVTEPVPDDPAFLKAVGRGDTAEKLVSSIINELIEEGAQLLRMDGEQRVFDLLLERVSVDVPASVVDEELRRRWGQAEGRVLSAKGFDAEEQKEALEQWLGDADLRAMAERRIKLAIVLRAIAEEHKLELKPDDLEEILGAVAKSAGLPPEEARLSLLSDSSLSSPVRNAVWHLFVAGYVLSHAKITYERD